MKSYKKDKEAIGQQLYQTKENGGNKRVGVKVTAAVGA